MLITCLALDSDIDRTVTLLTSHWLAEKGSRTVSPSCMHAGSPYQKFWASSGGLGIDACATPTTFGCIYCRTRIHLLYSKQRSIQSAPVQSKDTMAYYSDCSTTPVGQQPRVIPDPEYVRLGLAIFVRISIHSYHTMTSA